ncbi:MAG: amidohydrolase [Acidobacteriota bacterium]
MILSALMVLLAVNAPTPDLVLTNGKIWTGSDGQRFAQAVAVRADRIVAVGTNEEIIALGDSKTRMIDLHGKLVTPGFIDNHVHFVSGGFQLSSVQLRDAATPQEFARRIGEYSRTLPKGKWITGGDWDHQLWTPVALPTHQLVDEITPDNPIFVSRLDGHMALANALALRMAGITAQTPDPPGGTIVHDAIGQPTGILKDAAQSLIDSIIPSASVNERAAAARAALAEARAHGVTAFCDMSGGDAAFDDFRAYQQLERAGELTSRIYLFVPLASHERLAKAGIEHNFGSRYLQIGGLKAFADGSLGSSTAWFNQPYLDQPSSTGLAMPALTNGNMKKWVDEATKENLQVAVHAIGDRANDEVLKIFESEPGHEERRFRIEHAQHLNPQLIKRFAADRVVASMQPYHAIDDGRWAETKIDHERAKSTYAFRSLIDAGAVLVFGSDWTVAPLDPVLGIYAAVTRRTIDGKNPKGWIPEQKISVEEALKAYTVNGAWAMYREKELGRIAPGMLADLVVLSDDLFSIAPEAIEKVTVKMTIVGGKIVYGTE